MPQILLVEFPNMDGIKQLNECSKSGNGFVLPTAVPLKPNLYEAG